MIPILDSFKNPKTKDCKDAAKWLKRYRAAQPEIEAARADLSR